MSTRRPLLTTAAVALTLAATAAPAHADSIVFIKAHDVWIAAPDGTSARQVTTDGTEVSPYRSPSQADDGTIVAGHITSVVRMDQQGNVLARIDPPGVRDASGGLVDGQVVSAAISPDGSKIAYSMVQGSCPVAWECGTRAVTGVLHTARPTAPGELAAVPYGSPRWVGSGRLVVTGGYLHHANLVHAADGAGTTLKHWFDDEDYFADSSDLGEVVVSRDGLRVAAIHGYDGDWPGSVRRLIWFGAREDARAGTTVQSIPEALCVTEPQAGTHAPTWSPDGRRLAFQVPAGVEVSTPMPRDHGDCEAFATTLALPGATEPDWGPADVQPARGPVAGGGGAPSGGSGAGGAPGADGSGGAAGGGSAGAGSASVRVRGSKRLGTVLRTGLRLRISGAAPRTRYQLRLRVSSGDARRLRLTSRTLVARTVTTSAAGGATVTLRPPATAARRLRRTSKVRVTLTGGPAPASILLRR